MPMDPDAPGYADDALDEYNDVERCEHGLPFDESCLDCRIWGARRDGRR